MARIDWVDHGLHNWARWKITGGGGGFGRHMLEPSSVFDVRISGGYREPPIPVTDHEAALMDRALVDLQVKEERLHRTVLLAYIGHPDLGSMTRAGIARIEGISPSTVQARLEQSDQRIAVWHYEHRTK